MSEQVIKLLQKARSNCVPMMPVNMVTSLIDNALALLSTPASTVSQAVMEREAFEAKFPMPSSCVRCGDGYASTGYSAWDAQNYIHKWEAWQARAALSQPQADHSGDANEMVQEPDAVAQPVSMSMFASKADYDAAQPKDAVLAEPVAWMFHVREDAKSVIRSRSFAALDYHLQENETLLSKEPLFFHPPVAPKPADKDAERWRHVCAQEHNPMAYTEQIDAEIAEKAIAQKEQQ